MTLTGSQLEQMAPHVAYEVDEFRKAAQILSRHKKDDAEWNKAIELFVLHFRILRAFFFVEGRKPDDVSARDYIANWNPERAPIFETTKDDIDKRLAHLTTWRLATFKFDWPAPVMYDEMEALISKFRTNLGTSQTSWFKGLEPPRTVIVLSTAANYSTCTCSPTLTTTFLDYNVFRLP